MNMNSFKSIKQMLLTFPYINCIFYSASDPKLPFLTFLVQSALLGWLWGLPAAKALRRYGAMALWRYGAMALRR